MSMARPILDRLLREKLIEPHEHQMITESTLGTGEPEVEDCLDLIERLGELLEAATKERDELEKVVYDPFPED